MTLSIKITNQHAQDLGQLDRLPAQYSLPASENPFPGALASALGDPGTLPQVVVKRRRSISLETVSVAHATSMKRDLESDAPILRTIPPVTAAERRVHRIPKPSSPTQSEAESVSEPFATTGVEGVAQGLRATKRAARKPRGAVVQSRFEPSVDHGGDAGLPVSPDRWDFMAPSKRSQQKLDELQADLSNMQALLEKKTREPLALPDFLGASTG